MVDSSQYDDIPEIEQLAVNLTSVSACYKVLIKLKCYLKFRLKSGLLSSSSFKYQEEAH